MKFETPNPGIRSPSFRSCSSDFVGFSSLPFHREVNWSTFQHVPSAFDAWDLQGLDVLTPATHGDVLQGRPLELSKNQTDFWQKQVDAILTFYFSQVQQFWQMQLLKQFIAINLQRKLEHVCRSDPKFRPGAIPNLRPKRSKIYARGDPAPAIQPVELPSGHPLLLHQSVPREKQKISASLGPGFHGWTDHASFPITSRWNRLAYRGSHHVLRTHPVPEPVCISFPGLLFWKLLQRLHQEQLKSLECKDMTPSLMESWRLNAHDEAKSYLAPCVSIAKWFHQDHDQHPRLLSTIEAFSTNYQSWVPLPVKLKWTSQQVSRAARMVTARSCRFTTILIHFTFSPLSRMNWNRCIMLHCNRIVNLSCTPARLPT